MEYGANPLFTFPLLEMSDNMFCLAFFIIQLLMQVSKISIGAGQERISLLYSRRSKNRLREY